MRNSANSRSRLASRSRSTRSRTAGKTSDLVIGSPFRTEIGVKLSHLQRLCALSALQVCNAWRRSDAKVRLSRTSRLTESCHRHSKIGQGENPPAVRERQGNDETEMRKARGPGRRGPDGRGVIHSGFLDRWVGAELAKSGGILGRASVGMPWREAFERRRRDRAVLRLRGGFRWLIPSPKFEASG